MLLHLIPFMPSLHEVLFQHLDDPVLVLFVRTLQFLFISYYEFLCD